MAARHYYRGFAFFLDGRLEKATSTRPPGRAEINPIIFTKLLKQLLSAPGPELLRPGPLQFLFGLS